MAPKQTQIDQQRAALDKEYDDLNKEVARLRPQFTDEHRQAADKVLAVRRVAKETAELEADAKGRARENRAEADRLEKQFNDRVQQVERSGKPDPNPDATRALAKEMDKAAQAADAAEQNYRNAQQLRDRTDGELTRAENELENARQHDPVYQDLKPKLDDFRRRDVELNGEDATRGDHGDLPLQQRNWEIINDQIDADPAYGGDPDGVRHYPAAAAASADSDLGLDADGHDDAAMGAQVAALDQQVDDVSDATQSDSSPFGSQADDLTAEGTPAGGIGDVEVDSGGDAGGFADFNQPEPEVAAAEPAPEQEFEESADYA